MTPEAAKDKKLGVKYRLFRNSPKVQKEGVTRYPKLGPYVQNVHLWPHVPL